MQTEEILARLPYSPGGLAGHVDTTMSSDGQEWVEVSAPVSWWQALLPTAEERLALKALRVGVWVERNEDDDWYHAWQQRGFSVLNLGRGTTAISAYAAAGRVLEEGEKRG